MLHLLILQTQSTHRQHPDGCDDGDDGGGVAVVLDEQTQQLVPVCGWRDANSYDALHVMPALVYYDSPRVLNGGWCDIVMRVAQVLHMHRLRLKPHRQRL